MNFVTRLKIAWLLLRVIKLQAKAPEGIYYSLVYHGITNEVDFARFRKVNGMYAATKRLYCYIGKDHGATLEEIAEQITEEEKNV